VVRDGRSRRRRFHLTEGGTGVAIHRGRGAVPEPTPWIPVSQGGVASSRHEAGLRVGNCD